MIRTLPATHKQVDNVKVFTGSATHARPEEAIRVRQIQTGVDNSVEVRYLTPAPQVERQQMVPRICGGPIVYHVWTMPQACAWTSATLKHVKNSVEDYHRFGNLLQVVDFAEESEQKHDPVASVPGILPRQCVEPSPNIIAVEKTPGKQQWVPRGAPQRAQGAETEVVDLGLDILHFAEIEAQR